MDVMFFVGAPHPKKELILCIEIQTAQMQSQFSSLQFLFH